MLQNYIKYNAKTASKSTPSFTRKERDSETGFSYFGARYYDSDILTGWLSVDPMADKYPSLLPMLIVLGPDQRELMSTA